MPQRPDSQNIEDDPDESQTSPTKPSMWGRLPFPKFSNWRKKENEECLPDARSPPQCDPNETYARAVPKLRRPTKEVVPGLPRPITFRRQDSERRERLFPYEPCEDERRAVSHNRKRALSARPAEAAVHALAPRRSVPDVHAQGGSSALLALINTSPDGRANLDFRRVSNQSDAANTDLSPSDAPPLSYADQFSDLDSLSEGPSNDPHFREQLEKKWILNLSMHFRDQSEREKFFITYAEQLNRWRRITISCDYRNAVEDSLESDLKTLHFQRDKSARIYESIWESLPDIQFYETVTNLKLQTSDHRLHIHVTEDVNEIIKYPSITAIEHLQCARHPYLESTVHFESHLSGFVYKVLVNGRICIKKEIPSPDTVDEFLYEVNALSALQESQFVIDLVGVVVNEESTIIKGLLIAFANGGALVDLIADSGKSPLSWPRRATWAKQIVAGLAAIHEHGYVQGDFTLSNIVIDSNDRANIIDINRRGCPIGWEPPELVGLIQSGQRISMYISVKTDLWQLGMVLWALAKLKDEPEREEDPLVFDDDEDANIPLVYQEVVRSCLSTLPKDRKSAADLLVLLGDLDTDGLGSQATEYTRQSSHSGSRPGKHYIDPAEAVDLEDVEEHKRLHPSHKWDKMSIVCTSYADATTESRSREAPSSSGDWTHVNPPLDMEAQTHARRTLPSLNTGSTSPTQEPHRSESPSGYDTYSPMSDHADSSPTRRLLRKSPFELDENGNIRSEQNQQPYRPSGPISPPLHQDSGYDEAVYDPANQRIGRFMTADRFHAEPLDSDYDTPVVNPPQPDSYFFPSLFPRGSRLSPDYSVPSFPPALPGSLPRDLAGLGAHTIEEASSLQQNTSRSATLAPDAG